MKASTCATSTSTPLMSPTNAGAGDHDHDRERPGNAVFDLKADRQNVPHARCRSRRSGRCGRPSSAGSRRATSSATIDLSREDRADVEPGRERVGQQDREEDDQQQASEAAGRRPAAGGRSLCPRVSAASSGRVGSSALDLMDCMCGLRGRACARGRCRPMLADAAASRFSTDRSAACEFARRPGRDRTPARDGRLWRLPRNRSRRSGSRRPPCSATSNSR